MTNDQMTNDQMTNDQMTNDQISQFPNLSTGYQLPTTG